MKYTLAQIFGALGSVENGQDMINSLQNIIDANRQADKSGEILKKLGVNSVEELEKVVSTLDTFKKAGNDPTALTAQLTQLTNQVKDLTAKYEQSEAKAKEEREKRIRRQMAKDAAETGTVQSSRIKWLKSMAKRRRLAQLCKKLFHRLCENTVERLKY